MADYLHLVTQRTNINRNPGTMDTKGLNSREMRRTAAREARREVNLNPTTTMKDKNYRGVEIIDAWQLASKMKGATRPSYERWEAFIAPGHRVAGNTLAEIKAEIDAALQQVV